MRALLLGRDNPLSDDPRHALAPYPERSAGHRLYRAYHERTGAMRAQYLASFDRANLVVGQPWSMRAARAAAPDLLRRVAGRTIVPLGADVRHALGLADVLIQPQERHGATWRCLPHPSGRCRWWNDPRNRDAAALLLEELAAAGRGAPEEG